jgi:hypothetical protein
VDEVRDAPAVLPMDLDDGRTTRGIIPMRYQIRDEGKTRYLTCVDAPNVQVRVDRSFSVSASGARKYPEHSLFLDGAAQGEPFIDSSRRVHNLDHHEGCVRSFTLATCEQAMVMVLKGLDLDGETWTVYASEPDLDTVLAVWVLVNHRRIASDGSRVRRRVMPLLRLQGTIDAHGFELAELTGFPVELQRRTQNLIDRLRADEVRQREAGTWSANDPLEYTLSVLMAIDVEVYESADFGDDADVEELERIPLGGDRFAIACRSETGIYEVEQHLRGIHGDRLGLILLERDAGAWTVRQVDPFLPFGLQPVYDRLNLLDSAVDGDNRWGGSGEIGGSPRRTGTDLDLAAITAVCRWVFRPPGTRRKLGATLSAVAVAVASVAVAALAVVPVRGPIRPPGLVADAGATAAFSVCLVAAAVLLTVLGGRRLAPSLCGLRPPAAGRWPALILVMVVAAMAGGGWGAVVDGDGLIGLASVGWRHALYLALGAGAVELLLRGVVHGTLAAVFPIMIPRGRWFLSAPLEIVSVVSVVCTVVLFLPTPVLSGAPFTPGLRWVAWLIAAAAMALAAGVVRERSASVWPVVAFHAAAMPAAWLLLNLMV